MQTPCYVYDLALLRRTLSTITAAAAGLPARVHYALKANPDERIVAEVARAGFGADCVSIGEVRRAIECGIPAERCVYSGVGKTDAEITEAIRKVTDYKTDINDYLDLLVLWYRDILLFKATRQVEGLVFSDEINYISAQASKSSYEGLERIIEALEKAKVRLKANVNFELTMELLLLTIKEN